MSSFDQDYEFPLGLKADNLISKGLSGLVFKRNKHEVVKIPRNDEARRALEVEIKIYTRFSKAECGYHTGILKYRGCEYFDDGASCALRLERAPRGTLSDTLRRKHSYIAARPDLQERWIEQIIFTLGFVHSQGIVHGDLACDNILLDKDWNAKLADFAGSSIDGSAPLVLCRIDHQTPRKESPVKADIFALGCVLYHITTGKRPSHGVERDEIQKRYKAGNFPDLSIVPERLHYMRGIIQDCWEGNFDEVSK